VLAGAKVVVPPPPAATLWRALEDLDEGRAEKLLQKASEEEVNRRGGPYASTPLGWVAQAGSTRLARTLLARSADPNIAAEKGSLPLHMATWNGDFAELAEALLEAGAKPDAHNAHGQTALDVAIAMHELERKSPWYDVLDTKKWLKHVGDRPVGRSKTIIALSKALGVDPPASALEEPAAPKEEEEEEGAAPKEEEADAEAEPMAEDNEPTVAEPDVKEEDDDQLPDPDAD